MTDLRKAAKQALEALTCTGEDDDLGHRCGHCDDYVDRNGLVRAALRAALEQQAEPVASLMTNVQSGDVEVVWNDDGFDREMWHETPLYTAQPQCKPLTDKEIWEIHDACIPPAEGYVSPVEFARAIEQAHGIGEKP